MNIYSIYAGFHEEQPQPGHGQAEAGRAPAEAGDWAVPVLARLLHRQQPLLPQPGRREAAAPRQLQGGLQVAAVAASPAPAAAARTAAAAELQQPHQPRQAGQQTHKSDRVIK